MNCSQWHRWIPIAFGTAAVLLLIGCASSPTGRTQLIIVSDQAVDRMGSDAFAQISAQLTPSRDEQAIRRVQCIVDAITPVVLESHVPKQWQVAVFAEPAVNAFAVPGGYIGVFEGMLNLAEDQHQLAAVIGHEMAHVTARHAAERISQHETTGFAVRILAGSTGSDQAAALLGLGAQVGILLPFSRAQELEADVLGLQYMAQAGFDPMAAVALWENMEAASRRAPPEFLSTHPSSRARIDALRARTPEAMQWYEEARSQGRAPECD